MFSEIDKSYSEGNEGEEEVLKLRKKELEGEIENIFKKYLTEFLEK